MIYTVTYTEWPESSLHSLLKTFHWVCFMPVIKLKVLIITSKILWFLHLLAQPTPPLPLGLCTHCSLCLYHAFPSLVLSSTFFGFCLKINSSGLRSPFLPPQESLSQPLPLFPSTTYHSDCMHLRVCLCLSRRNIAGFNNHVLVLSHKVIFLYFQI